MPKNGRRIVLVGGGSNAWTPNIVKDMLLTDALAGSTFVLHDIDRPAAELVASFLRRLDARLGTGSRFVVEEQPAKAFDGAGYVVITISTGGLDAMAHDIALPEEYGIYHTVGDTAGPGGWARSLRNYPVFVGLARNINRYAPGAMVLNYTNPMTVLTTVLSRLCAGPVVGLCHGLFENLEFLTDCYGLKDESELSVSYAGVNHFFWMNAVHAGGRDLLADLRRSVAARGFTALVRERSKDPEASTAHRELATAMFNETGIMPYLGDRHTCEFFPCYITSREVMKRYRLVRTPIAERREGFRRRAATLRALAGGSVEIPAEYFTRSRETAADIINAHATGRSFIDVGNLPNVGQVSNLPRGAVLETAVRVDGNGFSPLCFGELPQPVLGLVEPVVHSFQTTVDACERGDKKLAFQALRLDPVCARLTGEQVEELGSRLIAAHRRFTDGMFGSGRATGSGGSAAGTKLSTRARPAALPGTRRGGA